MVSVDPDARIFLVNVGVNASHGAIRSPIFPDGTFEFLPIPEDRAWWSPTLPAYPKLSAFNDPDKTLAQYAPASRWNDRLHDDPEFRTFTYGDNPQTTGRGAGLKQGGPGDYIVFLARLAPHDGEATFHGPPGFYLVGFFRVSEVLQAVKNFPTGREFAVFGANAHIRRAAFHPKALNLFWVWKGDPEASLRLPKAVPFDRALAEATLLDARGRDWKWDTRRSELQTIGSYTRSGRMVIDPATPGGQERANRLWRAVIDVNPDVAIGEGGDPLRAASSRMSRATAAARPYN